MQSPFPIFIILLFIENIIIHVFFVSAEKNGCKVSESDFVILCTRPCAPPTRNHAVHYGSFGHMRYSAPNSNFLCIERSFSLFRFIFSLCSTIYTALSPMPSRQQKIIGSTPPSFLKIFQKKFPKVAVPPPKSGVSSHLCFW